MFDNFVLFFILPVILFYFSCSSSSSFSPPPVRVAELPNLSESLHWWLVFPVGGRGEERKKIKMK